MNCAKNFSRVLLFFMMVATVSFAAAQGAKSVTDLHKGPRTISGMVKGKGYLDFRVAVGAGQSISVKLSSKSQAVFFNLNLPKSEIAMYNSSTFGNNMLRRAIPIDGTHVVRVYQMGAAADEGKSSTYSLTISVMGKPIKAISNLQDATIAGTPFHARTIAPCTIQLDPSIKTCTAYVIRRANKSATLEFRAGNWTRRVLIVNGTPKGSDFNGPMKFSRKRDNFEFVFGNPVDEKYSIPNILIFGG